MNPLDFFNLANEHTTNNGPTFADATAVLEVLNANRFVLSANVAAGTAYTLSGEDYGTLFVREPITIGTAGSDQGDFMSGLIRVAIETRLIFRPHTNHATAAAMIVNV